MIPHQIFAYWESIMPPYIQHCLSTFSRSGVKVIFLDPTNVGKYIGHELHHNWKKLVNIAQKTDCIRIPIMYENGGMWADADTIFIKDCKHLFNSNADFIGLKWSNNRILNGYFMAPTKSNFLCEALEQLNKILTENFKERYYEAGGVYLGEELLMSTSAKRKINIINRETFIPIEFPFNREIWYKNIPIESFLKPETVSIALNHSQYPANVVNSDISAFCRRRDLLGNIFRYSIKLDSHAD